MSSLVWRPFYLTIRSKNTTLGTSPPNLRKECVMGLNTPCPLHGNEHPDFLCPLSDEAKEKANRKARLATDVYNKLVAETPWLSEVDLKLEGVEEYQPGKLQVSFSYTATMGSREMQKSVVVMTDLEMNAWNVAFSK